MYSREEILQELQNRQGDMIQQELIRRNELYRGSLYEYLKYHWKNEKKIEIDTNRHIELICKKLEDVFYGRIKRLIINIPPRSLKSEIVSITFPARAIGNRANTKIMGVSYSAGLAQDNSMKCRGIYESDTFLSVFPDRKPISDDQNTKQYRTTTGGGQYYASGSTGTITGKGCDIMLIDDPLKPGDGGSDTKRIAVNNNYHDTLFSRLNSKTDGAIVVIMQRLHDDDLCGHLLAKEAEGTGESREVLKIPAIAEYDDEHRKAGESFFEKRFPIDFLHNLREQDKAVFSAQYQQEPTNKDTQEFHQERFRYHGTDMLATPPNLRIFTAVDPAFKQGQENDETAIITAGFSGDRCYILEITHGRFTPDVMQDKIIYHIQKRSPEKIGIEAFQAQSMIVSFLKSKLQQMHLWVNIEEIRQTGDKLSKIRKLIPFYKNGLIYHKIGMDTLETQLFRFPRGKHDDIIDCLQMVYDLYELQPNTNANKFNFRIDYAPDGTPIYIGG